MGFYHIDPNKIRELQPSSAAVLLNPDGSNLTTILSRMSLHDVADQRRISDGTLRALGILAALFQSIDYFELDTRQPDDEWGQSPSFVSIEEPELALHPFATRVLFDALRDASNRTQVLVTSHSPDLMDDRDIKPDAVRVVSAQRGITTIGLLDAASRKIIQEDLFTVGEMTRRMELRTCAFLRR
jgi:hypothetical protein